MSQSTVIVTNYAATHCTQSLTVLPLIHNFVDPTEKKIHYNAYLTIKISISIKHTVGQ